MTRHRLSPVTVLQHLDCASGIDDATAGESPSTEEIPRRSQVEYQRENSALTLAEGLEEYYASYADHVLRPTDLAPESSALFRSHDMCHVIFGLGTSLDDEVIADMRTLVSCDVGLRRYVAYLAQDEHVRALFRETGYFKSLWATVLATPRICRALVEAWRMKKRWPWVPPESFHSRTLRDLRREFGIRVI